MRTAPAAAHLVRVAAALAPLLASLAAGCGSSVTDPGRKQALTAEEALLAESAVRTTGLSALRSGIGTNGLQLTPGSAPRTFTAACPAGGAVDLSLTLTRTLDATGTGTSTAASAFTPRGCVVSIGTRSLAIDGAPSLVSSTVIPVVNGRLSSTAPAVTRVAGDLTIDGSACHVDYTVTSAGADSLSVSGTVCGYPAP